MSETVAREIRRLAHMLGTQSAELAFLSALTEADARALRRQISDTLFEADRHLFTRVVAASRLLPVAVSVRITEFAMPPLVAARAAELLDASRAVEMVNRMSNRYVADVAAAMDPERSPEVVRQLPPNRVGVVAAELARREEWVVMSGFVALVSPAALQAAVSTLDGGQLLHIGYVLDDTSRLDEIASLLTDRHLDQMLDAAAERSQWTELDGLLTRLDDSHRARLAARCTDEFSAAAQAAVAAGRFSAAGSAALRS
jgi:hypothetical protein